MLVIRPYYQSSIWVAIREKKRAILIQAGITILLTGNQASHKIGVRCIIRNVLHSLWCFCLDIREQDLGAEDQRRVAFGMKQRFLYGEFKLSHLFLMSHNA